MPIVNQNEKAAWVNNSSYSIPVYQGLITRPGGGVGAGGTQIGTIYPNEFYVTVPRADTNACYYKIYFRNSNGVKALGYIETEPGGWSTGFEPWTDLQSHYVNYNSNGYSLQYSTGETINGVNYRIFTVKKSVVVKYPSGVDCTTLQVGDKLATYESTTGQTYNSYMVFHKRKSVGNSTWSDITPNGYGFVNLGLELGSMPSNRAIW